MADINKQMQDVFGALPTPQQNQGVPQASPDDIVDNPFTTPTVIPELHPVSQEGPPPVSPDAPEWVRNVGGAYRAAQKLSQGKNYSLMEDLASMPAHFGIGMAKGFEEGINFGKWITGNADSETHYVQEMFPPETKAEGLSQGVGQFLLPFGALMKGLTWGRKLITGIDDLSQLGFAARNAIPLAEGAVAGILTGEITVNPNDPTLANMIDRDTSGLLKRTIYDWMATDPNDPEGENRFKQALFNAGFGAAADSLITMVKGGFTLVKNAIKTANPGMLQPGQEFHLDVARQQFNWNLDEYSLPAIRQTPGQIIKNQWRKSVQAIFDEAKGAKYLDQEASKTLNANNPEAANFHAYEILSMADHTGQMADIFMQRGPVAKETFTVERIQGTNQYQVVGDRSGPTGQTFPRKRDAEIIANKNNALGVYKVTGRPGLAKILEPVFAEGHQENFFMYMTGIRARNLKNKGIDVPFDDDTIDAMIANGHGPNGPATFTHKGQTVTYDQVLAQMWTYNNDLLNFAVQHGVLSKEMAAQLSAQGPFVPFYRLFEDDKTQVPGRGIITGADANAFKKIYGSDKYQLENPLVSLMNNTATIIQQSLNNSARRAIYDQIDALNAVGRSDIANKYAMKAENPAVPFNVKQEDVAKALDRAGVTIDLSTVNPNDWMTFFNRGRMKLGNSTDVVYRNGKAEVYQLNDQLLANSMAALGPNLALRLPDMVIREGTRFKNILTQGVTSAVPFVARNATRDAITYATLHQKAGVFDPMVAMARLQRDKFAYDPEYTEYLANGGGYNLFWGDTSRDTYDRFMHYYTSRGFNPSQINPIEDLWQKWQGFVGNVETAPRFGQYLGQVRNGENARLAAYAGRQVTTDFSKEGSAAFIKWMNRNVPFLRAGMAGMYRMGTLASTKEGAKLLAIRYSTALLPATMTLWYMNHNDPRYTNLPDYIRDNNWVIIPDRIPGASSVFPKEYMDELNKSKFPGVILIPKPYELGALTSVAERGLDHIFAQAPGFDKLDPQGLGEFAGQVQSIFQSAFHISMLPQAVSPLWDLYVTNQNYQGGPIESDAMKDRKPELRVDAYTSPSMVNLGQNIGMSPIQLEYLFKGYTGTLGAAVLDWADRHVTWDKEHQGLPPAARWDEMPVLDVFYKGDPLKSTQNQIDFYNIYKKVQQESKSYGVFDNKKNPVERVGNITSQEYLTNPHNIFLGKAPTDFMQSINKQNGLISDMIRQTITNKALTPQQKLEEMDKWRAERDKLFETAMNTIKHEPAFRPLLRYKFSTGNIGRYLMPSDMPNLNTAQPVIPQLNNLLQEDN